MCHKIRSFRAAPGLHIKTNIPKIIDLINAKPFPLGGIVNTSETFIKMICQTKVDFEYFFV